MPTKQEDRLFRDFVSAAQLHGEATLNGDDKLANKQAARLAKIYRHLQGDRQFALSFLQALFQHPSASVRVWASAHALGLGIQTNEASSILEQVSGDSRLGILRLDAQMTLKEWRKKGKLEF